MLECNLPISADVYDLFKRYLILIPMDNITFIDFFNVIESRKYGCYCGNSSYAYMVGTTYGLRKTIGTMQQREF